MFSISAAELSARLDTLRAEYPRIWAAATRGAPRPTVGALRELLREPALPNAVAGVEMLWPRRAELEAALAVESDESCDATLEAESVARMRIAVDACFRTDRGAVELENELALWDGADPAAWVRRMRDTWESRLHSAWVDEFMEALELWVAGRVTSGRQASEWAASTPQS